MLSLIEKGEYVLDRINAIPSLDYVRIHQVLASESLTDGQKAEFIKKNSAQIKSVLETEITKDEFKKLMEQRPLVRFRPLKNSFTKQGDDELLARALNINKKDIKKYINSILSSNFEIHDRQERDNIESTKSYVYRHGTKEQVVAFLEYELSDVKHVLQNLYKTLDENSGGFAGYFNRPIHRMDNRTMRKIYNVVDKSLKKSADGGFITSEQQQDAARWALVKIYQIQNNSRLIRACEAYCELSS